MLKLVSKLKRVNYEEIESDTLIDLMWNLENLYTFLAKGRRMSEHILTYFLSIIVISVVNNMFNSYIPRLDPAIYFTVNLLFLFFGLFLLIKGVKIYLTTMRFMKVLLIDIKRIKRTIEDKKNKIND